MTSITLYIWVFEFFIVTLQERLEKINDALCSEYECRRRMLMKRLDVTVQSFGWSDRAKVNLMYFLLPVGGSLLQFPNSSYRICIPCKYTNKLPSLLSFLQPVSHPKYPSSCNIQILGIEEGGWFNQVAQSILLFIASQLEILASFVGVSHFI